MGGEPWWDCSVGGCWIFVPLAPPLVTSAKLAQGVRLFLGEIVPLQGHGRSFGPRNRGIGTDLVRLDLGRRGLAIAPFRTRGNGGRGGWSGSSASSARWFWIERRWASETSR